MIAGQLEIQMLANLARLQKDMNEAKGVVNTAMRDIERSVERVKSVFATGFVAGGLVVVAKQAMEAEQAINRLDAVVRATGNASGYTKEQLHGMADAMAEATQFDDEDIRNATASLLKFGNIHSETLVRALKLSGDYAAFTKTDMATASEALGKAISSPAQGIERLQRSIGYLNPAQVEAIKNMQEMGDVAGAQASLLQILEQKIGGVAETMNTGYTKAFQDAKKATGEFFETVGGTAAVQGTVQSFLGFVTSSMRDMKHILEDGDWLQALKFVMGFRQTDEQAAARKPAQAITADAAVAAAAALEADKKFKEALAKQDEQFIVGALKRQKEAAAKAETEAQKLREIQLKAGMDLLAMDRQVAEEIAALMKVGDDRLLQLDDEIDRYRMEADAIGKTNVERAIELLDYQKKLALRGPLTEDQRQAIEMKYEELKALAALRIAREEDAHLQRQLADQSVSMWSEAGNALGGFLNALTNGMKSGVDYVKNLLKQLLAQMISLFAQRWVLNLGASLTSGVTSSALANAAGTVGNGTAAAGLLGFGSSVVAGYQGASLAAGLAGPTTAGASIFSGQGIGAALAGMGPVGWAALAVAAVAAVAYAFRDKGENWQGRLAFGDQAQAYTTEGLFGREGFAFIQGQDATNRAIQDFMARTKPLDESLAGRLTPAQIDSIRAALAGPYNTRNDGQPATFAFDRNDTTAAAQLTLEYVQKKYGAVFDVLDVKFAEFIRGYTGKAEDLLAAIGEFATLLDMLDASGIKGLNIEALRAFQRQGEELGATFARISQSFAEYQDLFLTDAEKFDMVQKLVNDTFATLGIAVPTSMEAFKDLVNGLDLSTEAGRNMFEALMAIAPGFATVANAAASAMASLMSTAGQLNPAFASGNARSSLVASVEAWRGLGDHGNWTVDQTIAQIGNLAHDQAALTAAIAYAQSLGGNAVGTLNNMLQSYIAWEASMNSSTGAVGGLAGSAASAGGALDDLAQRTLSVNGGLLDWINRTMLNPSLSPLSPEQRFLEAERQYQSVLASSRAGDLGARANLTGAADTYLELARMMFGSNADYTAIYRQVIGDVGGQAGMTQADVNAKLFGALPQNTTLASSADIGILNASVRELIMQIAAGIKTSDAGVAQAVEGVATNLKSASSSGAFA